MQIKGLQRLFWPATLPSLLTLACAVIAVLPPNEALGLGMEDAADRAEVRAFIAEMAEKHGFDRSELERAFGRTRLDRGIVELMNRQTKRKPWIEYRALFINDEKLRDGHRFWRENRESLRTARTKYGVPEEIVTAVIGIETHYGRRKGRYKVLEALTTLAFDYPRRSRMFRTELEHYLLLSREEGLSLESPLGSYAGAMGIAQFMPGSYRRYAIDFDRDGKRDLFDNPADAIGSVANYLTAHGWKRDEPVAARPEVAGDGVTRFRGARLTTRYQLSELRDAGVTVDGTFSGSRTAIPLTLRNHHEADAEYWLGFDNFYVITRYNNSVYYAMAVHQLATELRARFELPGPAGDRP
jgi:membrane-bound lytic murein transglycosylase B